jgi:hypothetical protein
LIRLSLERKYPNRLSGKRATHNEDVDFSRPKIKGINKAKINPEITAVNICAGLEGGFRKLKYKKIFDGKVRRRQILRTAIRPFE